MSIMDVHLRDLRYFVAVAEELNFTRAAERLYVSQPALSKQIRQLEQAMRATLLRRDPRGVTLTAAGALLLPSARRLLETWDGTARAVLAAETQDRRMLRLGMQTSIGRNLYPAVLRRFAEVKSDWRLTLRLCEWTDPSAGLLDESTDAAFIWLPVPAGLEYRVLLSEPRWVALPAEHHLAGRTEVELADLLDEPFVALPEQAGPMRDFWLAADERHGRPVRIGVEVSTRTRRSRRSRRGWGYTCSPPATPTSTPAPASPAVRYAGCPHATSLWPGGTQTSGHR